MVFSLSALNYHDSVATQASSSDGAPVQGGLERWRLHYGEMRGDRAFRSAVADFLRPQLGYAFDRENVVVTSSGTSWPESVFNHENVVVTHSLLAFGLTETQPSHVLRDVFS